MTIRIFMNPTLQRFVDRKVAFFLTFFVVVFLSYAFLSVIDFLPEPLSEETIAAREAKKAQENSALNQAVQVLNGGLRPKNNNTEDSLRVTIPEANSAEVETEPVSTKDPLPSRIIFDALDGKSVTVLNPTSNSVAALDEALLTGVVRHPDSADLVSNGNVFILGHSSYLPNVFNKNFQAFNGIQNLTWGDTIRVQSSDTEYIYRVDKVFKAKTSEVV
ncbi:sortase, partial [Candidatus Kaiserbacteria bacterium]|nr:sortase [Candidatus Kaiserbacteria bacterium]